MDICIFLATLHQQLQSSLTQASRVSRSATWYMSLRGLEALWMRPCRSLYRSSSLIRSSSLLYGASISGLTQSQEKQRCLYASDLISVWSFINISRNYISGPTLQRTSHDKHCALNKSHKTIG